MKRVFIVKCLEKDSIGSGVVSAVFDNVDSANSYMEWMQGLNSDLVYFVRDYDVYHSFNS